MTELSYSDNWEFNLGLGAGVQYALGGWGAGFSFKVLLGMTCHINELFGIGFNLNYSLSIIDGWFLNFIYPGVQINLKF